MKNVDDLLSSLSRAEKPASGGLVQSMNNTTRVDPRLDTLPKRPEARVDELFGQSSHYRVIKNERPEHRLMLWLSLNGHTPTEIAAQTGFTIGTVLNVRKQPWFQQAFCALSTEMGKDAVQTFLEGEVLKTAEQLVHLRDNAESEAVRKAACDSLLDRFLGRPTARVETKITGTFEHEVYDAAKLMEVSRRLDEQLKTFGAGGTN